VTNFILFFQLLYKFGKIWLILWNNFFIIYA